MNGTESARLLVFVDRATAEMQTLVDLKAAIALGFAELKVLIASGAPVLDVEMFTNDWYDGGAARVLSMLSNWDARGVVYTLREAPPGLSDDAAAGDRAPTIALGALRNVISAGEGERARVEELEDHRFGDGP